MSENTDVNEAIKVFPRLRARTLRFNGGAPRSAKVVGDGSQALFLRSDGPEDLVTALWLSWFDAAGEHHETKLADPRELLGAAADSEDVPAEERARRERAREGGAGIVSYSVDEAGDCVVFTINGRLYLTEIDWIAASGEDTADVADAEGAEGAESASGYVPVAHTRELAGEWLDGDPAAYTPVLNPRISPDGNHVLYTTGTHLMLVDIGDWPELDAGVAGGAADVLHEEPAGELSDGVDVESDAVEEALSEGLYGDADADIDIDADEFEDEEPLADRITAIYGVSVEDEDGNPAENTWKIGLAEFVAGEEMNRYDGFWWSPDSRHVLFESFDTANEPVWYISDPANPEHPAEGRRYPRALTQNADVYLTAITLAFDDDGRYLGITANADVDWDREAYEYVAAVSWTGEHDPLVLVQNRRQSADQVLEVAVSAAEESADFAEIEGGLADDVDEVGDVDGAAAVAADDTAAEPHLAWPSFGSTRVLEEHANDQWIDLVPGTPAYTPDGHLVCSLNDMAADTNRLTVDGRPFTPAGWNVREVLHVSDDGVVAVVQREPDLAPDVPAVWKAQGGEHDARSFDVVLFDFDAAGGSGAVALPVPITTTPGVWTASWGERGGVISGRDLAHAGVQMTHVVAPQPGSAAIASYAAEPGFTPNLHFVRLGEHRLYTAIIAPSPESPYAAAEKLPVLMKPYGGPGFQQVVDAQSFYWESQWWADQGFLVVTADGRGTTGRGPAWDRAIFENMKDITLADQIEAVNALPAAVAGLNAAIPAPDLDKVCMIGWSYGGFLSALAVLDAPNVFKAACAGAPPTEWTLYDTHYTERYLGLDPDVYYRNGIIQDAPKLERPLMLIHGFADDNVTIAHSLKLSQALMAAGRPHTYLPLTGITHMTNDETVAENLLTLQRDFLKDALA